MPIDIKLYDSLNFCSRSFYQKVIYNFHYPATQQAENCSTLYGKLGFLYEMGSKFPILCMTSLKTILFC